MRINTNKNINPEQFTVPIPAVLRMILSAFHSHIWYVCKFLKKKALFQLMYDASIEYINTDSSGAYNEN